MGLDGDADQGVSLPAFDQGFGIFQTFFDGTVIGGGEVVENFADKGPHPGFFGRIRDPLFEKIHIEKSGGPGTDHLGAGQKSAPVNLVPVRFGFRREDIPGQPFHQGKVVGHAAIAGHGGMVMAIDQAGHDQATGGVDGPGGFILRGDFFGAPKGGNPIPDDGHGSGEKGLGMFGEGKEIPVGNKKVGRFLGL